MSKEYDRLIKLIDLTVKSLHPSTNHKSVYKHLEEVLKQIKFDPSKIDIDKFEDTLLFAISEYIKQNLLTGNLESKTEEPEKEKLLIEKEKESFKHRDQVVSKAKK